MKAQCSEIPVTKACSCHLSGERKKVLNWLLSYNPLWLRIGLEVFWHVFFFWCPFPTMLLFIYFFTLNIAHLQTIYGELISLESNSDTLGLAVFILQRLLWNPDIAAEFRHPRVPHLYKDGNLRGCWVSVRANRNTRRAETFSLIEFKVIKKGALFVCLSAQVCFWISHLSCSTSLGLPLSPPDRNTLL